MKHLFASVLVVSTLASTFALADRPFGSSSHGPPPAPAVRPTDSSAHPGHRVPDVVQVPPAGPDRDRTCRTRSRGMPTECYRAQLK